MNKKKIFRLLKSIAIAAMAILLVACGNDNDGGTSENGAVETPETLNVISSFSILTDMVEEIGGEYVNVHNLVPIGTDPHDYEPLPEDIKAATDADILLYNGLNLEGGENGWFFRLINSVDQSEENVYEIAKDVEPMYIADEAGQQEVNPHAFISPQVGIQMAETIRDTLVEAKPDQAEYFEQSAAEYLEQLERIDTEYTEGIGAIPEEDRVFVASEQAFQYMTNEYGLEEGYIWAVDTDETGSPEQIKSTVEFVNEKQPNVLFVESNVDTRPMETVSSETGVEIYDRPILSDEIGQPGEEGDTYLSYLEYNLDVITGGLSE